MYPEPKVKSRWPTETPEQSYISTEDMEFPILPPHTPPHTTPLPLPYARCHWKKKICTPKSRWPSETPEQSYIPTEDKENSKRHQQQRQSPNYMDEFNYYEIKSNRYSISMYPCKWALPTHHLHNFNLYSSRPPDFCTSPPVDWPPVSSRCSPICGRAQGRIRTQLWSPRPEVGRPRNVIFNKKVQKKRLKK